MDKGTSYPGRNLGRLVGSIIHKKPIRLRTAMVGGLEGAVAAAVIGGGAYFLLKNPHKPLDFEETVNTLALHYTLGDHKKLGEKLVFLLEDRHYESYDIANEKKVNFLHEQFGIPLVGKEGTHIHPNNPENKKAMAKIREFLTISIEDIHDLSDNAEFVTMGSFGNDDWAYTSDDFEGFGLERVERSEKFNESLFDVALVSEAEDIYTMFSSGMSRGYIPLEINGKLTYHMALLLKIQEHYKDDPTFPVFDLKDFEKEKIENQEFRFLSNNIDGHNPYMGKRMVFFMRWRDHHLLHPRTEYASNTLVEKMDEEGYFSSALIFGKAHMDKDKKMPTFQQEMEKLGVSYIVLPV